jgi:hypothetical protein
MTRKPARPRQKSDPEQLKRFTDMAREVGVDESEGAFDRALDKVLPRRPKKNDHGGQNR